jgi:hypothetical protein
VRRSNKAPLFDPGQHKAKRSTLRFDNGFPPALTFVQFAAKDTHRFSHVERLIDQTCHAWRSA